MNLAIECNFCNAKSKWITVNGIFSLMPEGWKSVESECDEIEQKICYKTMCKNCDTIKNIIK